MFDINSNLEIRIIDAYLEDQKITIEVYQISNDGEVEEEVDMFGIMNTINLDTVKDIHIPITGNVNLLREDHKRIIKSYFDERHVKPIQIY